MIDVLSIERGRVARARVDRATACLYARSNRIVLVADGGDFDAAQAALDELRAHAERKDER
ncbi:hypothetical protein [Mycolicibacterium canariasense]|uniref:hypothetical protein n=1 Tax=Mycolicibacterium canariasense TaxID=228230 RepID=UPI000A14ADFC|nr:hypothetical protein [Mycolicibacterium canariasense]MCV7208390.1 hypothetical protein [Mycolicibacterium canariasense]ORV13572.1 hypothetical protein AWB94_04960 [Mycolicibacterium canariasense]